MESENDCTPSGSSEKQNDAFSYLDMERFTAEKFKLEIRNLPKYYGMLELKKLLSNKLKLDVTKVKRPKPGARWIYICCRSEDARDEALKTLNGFKWKGKELTADVSRAIPDPYVMNKKNHESAIESAADLIEALKNATTPLWKVPHSDQLELKMKTAVNILKQLGLKLKEANSELKDWLQGQKAKYDNLPCELLPIRYISDLEDGYRNKCEFSIGINELTKEKTIGMRVGSYAKGSKCVVSPNDLIHVNSIMKKAVAVAEGFIRQSKLDVYNQENHEGYWKTLTARYGTRTNELMLMFTIESNKLDEAELTNVQMELKEYFAQSNVELYSLVLAVTTSNRDPPKLYIVSGQPFIHERICDLTLRISALAFFQVNTPVAEMMFHAISEIGNLDSETTLIDVCCGAGTIGLSLAKKCGQVLGLEICEEAIKDAKINSTENNIKNADFYTGKAENSELSSVVYRASKPKVLAVVDPPRAGLGTGAIAQLRKTSQVKRLIYVSCQPQLALKNFVDLGRMQSKKYPGEPLVPTKCIPFDMFPHTPRVELLILFERFSSVSLSTKENDN